MGLGPRLLKQNPQNKSTALNAEKLQAKPPSRDEESVPLASCYKYVCEEQIRFIND